MIKRRNLIAMSSTSVLLLIASCLGKSSHKNLESWLGNYVYNESQAQSYNTKTITTSWNLSINRTNDLYSSILNVN